MANDQIARVAYFERQFLRTQDFVDEQSYQIAMRRRHNIAHHRWGIVEGLKIVTEEGGLFVQPGMAIDGYGRELILPRRQPISLDAFVEKASSTLDAWLIYNRVASDGAPNGAGGCGENGTAMHYRWQETARLLLTVASPELPAPREAVGVADGDADFGPTRTPPDDPQRSWRVFLGRVIKPVKGDLGIEDDTRPYVGLVGESIHTPSGEVVIRLGAEDPDRDFAVFTSPAELTNNKPAFAIKNDGKLEVREDTKLFGNLTLVGGALEFTVGHAGSNVESPWHIYHAVDGNQQQLRVEIDKGAGDNQFAIGHWSEDEKKFHECLTVDENCTVTIHGNLVVEGQIKGNVNRNDLNLTTIDSSEDTKRFLVAASMIGIGGVPALLQLFNIRKIVPPDLDVSAFRQKTFEELLDELKRDSEQFSADLKKLLEDEETAKMIRELLEKG